MKVKLLIVEDEPDMLDALKRVLSKKVLWSMLRKMGMKAPT